MASYKNRLTLLLLCALAASAFCQTSQGGPHVSQGGGHVSQGGPHENQGRARRQIDQASAPVPCDVTTTPKFSCQDCNTRLVCTANGGFQAPCRNPMKPYCNNGFCSFVPAEGCV